jgi:hypothetical protein
MVEARRVKGFVLQHQDKAGNWLVRNDRLEVAMFHAGGRNDGEERARKEADTQLAGWENSFPSERFRVLTTYF